MSIFNNTKEKYYNIIPLLGQNARYNILLSTRSKGKSYQVKMVSLWEAFYEEDYYEFKTKGVHLQKKRYKFAYMRRWAEDIKGRNVSDYFADMPISEITNGEYNTVVYYQQQIYFANDTGTEVTRGKVIGNTFSLNSSERYKSRMFPEIGNVIYEEFITNKGYLPYEMDDFFSIISTIARGDEIRVFLVGNTLDRVCPYFNEWGLEHALKMQAGQIDIYKQPTDDVDEDGNPIYILVAVEFCYTEGQTNKMFFGHKSKSITGNEWETEVYPKLDKKFRDYPIHYRVMFKYMGFKFLINLMTDNKNNPFLYIYPYTGEETKIDRRVTDEFSSDPLITPYLTCVTKYDKIVIELLSLQKICYSDNMTGTDFNNAIRERRKL